MKEITDAQAGDLVSERITDLLKRGIRIAGSDPHLLLQAMRILRQQKKAAKRRGSLEKEGIHVPPFMIFSITHRCNLNCTGCYSRELQKGTGPELTEDDVDRIVKEAEGLGISIILVAGGEPLVKPWIIDVMASNKKVLFLLFTNGTMIDPGILRKLSRAPNIIPLFSIEGYEADTDERRGDGIWENSLKMMDRVNKAGIFYGVSLTLNRINYDLITSGKYVDTIIGMGCRLFIFVEYVPVKEGTETLCLTEEQNRGIIDLTAELEKKHPGLFVSFPGDEDKFGGCLSSGRGFVHVNPWGDLEPCPFAPYSDMNLKKISLKDALSSDLLKKIRTNRKMLDQVQGGCALWENREWLRSIVSRRPENEGN